MSGIHGSQLTLAYVLWNVFYFSILMPTWCIVIYRLRVAFKSQYIDTFKISQWVWAIIMTSTWVLTRLILIFARSNFMFWVRLNILVQSFIFFFHLTNQFLWIAMNIHLSNYWHVTKETYPQARIRVRRKEIILKVVYIVYVTFMLSSQITLALVQLFNEWIYPKDGRFVERHDVGIWEFYHVYERVILYFENFMQWFYIVSNIIIFILLTRLMRKHLNYYYNKKLWSLVLIIVSSSVYWVCRFFNFNTIEYFNSNIYVIHYLDNPDDYSTGQVIWIMFANILITIPIIFYITFNIRNINFSKYLWVLMRGDQIVEFFEEASIYAKKRTVKNPSIRFTMLNNDDDQVPPATSHIFPSQYTFDDFDSSDDENMYDYKKNYEKLKINEKQSKHLTNTRDNL